MAKDGITVDLVTAPFNRMLAELAAIDPKIEFADVVRSEAASVAQGALNRTKAASIQKINARSAAQKFTTFNGKTYYIDRNYRSMGLFEKLVNLREQTRLRRLNARGISKQSWAYIAKSLGRPAQAPAYVMAANYKGRQWPEDGTSLESYMAGTFITTITNSSPVVQKANGNFALAVSIQARTSYFKRNMEHAFYDTLAHRAKKYPGIFTSPVPSAI